MNTWRYRHLREPPLLKDNVSGARPVHPWDAPHVRQRAARVMNGRSVVPAVHPTVLQVTPKKADPLLRVNGSLIQRSCPYL